MYKYETEVTQSGAPGRVIAGFSLVGGLGVPS